MRSMLSAMQSSGWARFELAALLVCACTGGRGAATRAVIEPATGTVTLPLTATTNGHNYRVRNLSLTIYGSSNYITVNSTDDSNETELSATLPTGSYSASVYSYQVTIERDDGSGNFLPVKAQLISSQIPFSIYSGTTTTITFQFQTDGVVVTVGAGRLNAKVDIKEIAPACLPLGTECGFGRWCPPFDLSGVAPACVTAGTKGLGQACNGPTDCVANASCFDLGAGPACVALCSESSVGKACASGGICQTAGKTYGLCKGTVGGGGGSAGGGATGGAAGAGGAAGGEVGGQGGDGLCPTCTAENCSPQTDGCDQIANAADRALCENAYACFVDPKNNCTVGGDPTNCWCGTNLTTCLSVATGPGKANGPCLDAVIAAAKLSPGTSYDPRLIRLTLVDPAFPLGRAVNLTTCRGAFCSEECKVR